MDMDLQTGMGQDDSMFGIDNVGLDFNDFEILNGEISLMIISLLLTAVIPPQISSPRPPPTPALSSVCPPPPT